MRTACVGVSQRAVVDTAPSRRPSSRQLVQSVGERRVQEAAGGGLLAAELLRDDRHHHVSDACSPN